MYLFCISCKQIVATIKVPTLVCIRLCVYADAQWDVMLLFFIFGYFFKNGGGMTRICIQFSSHAALPTQKTCKMSTNPISTDRRSNFFSYTCAPSHLCIKPFSRQQNVQISTSTGLSNGPKVPVPYEKRLPVCLERYMGNCT